MRSTATVYIKRGKGKAVLSGPPDNAGFPHGALRTAGESSAATAQAVRAAPATPAAPPINNLLRDIILKGKEDT